MELAYTQYERHYKRVGNVALDYETVRANPEKYRIRDDWLPRDPDAAILDIGCGWGNLLLSLWVSGYRNLTGVDMSETMCAIAKSNLPDEVDICCADATVFLATGQKIYDVITIFDTLEHLTIEKAAVLLHQCYKALAPGGSIVVRTPNMANLLSAYSMYLDITHVQGYTEFSLFQLLDLSGFVDHRVVRPHPIASRLTLERLLGGLSKREFLNAIIHRVLFRLRGQTPVPTTFAYNLVVQSFKPR